MKMTTRLKAKYMLRSIKVFLRIPFEHDCEIDDGTSCTECCEHGDIDEGHCLDCGEDLTERLSARAYDAWKDSYKYGD